MIGAGVGAGRRGRRGGCGGGGRRAGRGRRAAQGRGGRRRAPDGSRPQHALRPLSVVSYLTTSEATAILVLSTLSFQRTAKTGGSDASRHPWPGAPRALRARSTGVCLDVAAARGRAPPVLAGARSLRRRAASGVDVGGAAGEPVRAPGLRNRLVRRGRPGLRADRHDPGSTATPSRSHISARSRLRREPSSPRAIRSAWRARTATPSGRRRTSTSAIRVSAAADGYVDPATLLPPRTVLPPPSRRRACPVARAGARARAPPLPSRRRRPRRRRLERARRRPRRHRPPPPAPAACDSGSGRRRPPLPAARRSARRRPAQRARRRCRHPHRRAPAAGRCGSARWRRRRAPLRAMGGSVPRARARSAPDRVATCWPADRGRTGRPRRDGDAPLRRRHSTRERRAAAAAPSGASAAALRPRPRRWRRCERPSARRPIRAPARARSRGRRDSEPRARRIRRGTRRPTPRRTLATAADARP